jgi:hypothetical protein
LVVACAVTIAAISVGASAVVIAGASGAGTTYYACLKAGKLTEVGTTSPTCKAASSVVSWNSQGPAGPAGTNGTNGAPGATGPAGPGAVYIADNSDGTLSGIVDTPDLLASNVNGFSVHLSCQANEEFDTADLQATLNSSDTSAQNVTSYTSLLTPSSDGPSSSTYGGNQLYDPEEFAIIDNLDPPGSGTLDSQGYVVANSGGIVSQPEAGFWFFLHLTFQLNSGSGGSCSVTGMLIPVSGNRTVPPEIILPPPVG